MNSAGGARQKLADDCPAGGQFAAWNVSQASQRALLHFDGATAYHKSCKPHCDVPHQAIRAEMSCHVGLCFFSVPTVVAPPLST